MIETNYGIEINIEKIKTMQMSIKRTKYLNHNKISYYEIIGKILIRNICKKMRWFNYLDSVITNDFGNTKEIG